MKITFPQPQGTLSVVTKCAASHYHVLPLLTHSGSQWFYWCGLVEGLARDEEAVIELEWPEVPRPEDLKGASAEVLYRFTQQGSFVEALPSVIGVSEDLESWEFPPCLRDGNVVSIRLRGTGRPFYVATQFPYTPMHLEALLAHVKTREPAAVQKIGESRAGLPIHAVVLESPSGPDAPTIYIQAYQHMTEFGGPWVADRMIRHLLDDPEGKKIRERFAFHIVPAVDLDGLTYGLNWSKAMGHTPKPAGKSAPFINKNINRDWEDQAFPEVRVVDRFLKSQREKNRRYCAGFDLHNGWIKADDSGACYTAFTEETGTASQREDQKRFLDHLYNATDHEPAGRYWLSPTLGMFSKYFFARTGVHLSHTVEFSRSLWWNRKTGRYDPYRPEHHERFAREMLAALTTWTWANPA